jgi:hypothetical protein
MQSSLLLARVFTGNTKQKCHNLHMLLCLLFSGALYIKEYTQGQTISKKLSSHYSTSPSLEVAVLSQAYSLPHLEAGSQCIFLLGVKKCATNGTIF